LARTRGFFVGLGGDSPLIPAPLSFLPPLSARLIHLLRLEYSLAFANFEPKENWRIAGIPSKSGFLPLSLSFSPPLLLFFSLSYFPLEMHSARAAFRPRNNFTGSAPSQLHSLFCSFPRLAQVRRSTAVIRGLQSQLLVYISFNVFVARILTD